MKFSKTLMMMALAGASLGANAADLITNGDFETYAGGSFSNGYRTVNNGSVSLAGWAVGGTSVDIVNGAFGAFSGNGIDMLGTPGPGSLSQSFASTVGQTYLLSFDLSRNGSSDPYINVSFAGGAVTQYVGGTSLVPAHYTLSYTASNASTLLTFSSVGNGNSGAVLDNVSVTAVPEPETYAMLLAGLGLIGMVRRRKNKAA